MRRLARMTPKIGVWMALAGLALPGVCVRAVEVDAPDVVLKKAEAGDAAAQLALGIAAEDNEAKPDYATAAKWYQRASAGGSGQADWQLGMLYETGDGVAQSYAEARACYERAVERGVEAANMRLGLFYLEGWGVAADRAKMLALITRAAESGYVPAMNMLSGMYFAGIGVARDGARALQWAERAAKMDDRDGQITVGRLAMRGLGLKRDVKLAREWFQLSAEQEYSTAMLAMASTFLRKGATAEDRANGKRWLELALENQSGEAGFLLAVGEFTSPESLPRDAEKRARAFLEKAVALGCMEASEVFELEKSGRRLRDALLYVATVPIEVRYLERSARWTPEKNPAERPPRIVKAVRPVYPSTMGLANQEGIVVLRFVVDTKGVVKDPEIVSSSHPAFTESALQAIQRFRFEPGVKNGSAVNTRMQMPIHFQLKVPVTRSSPASSSAEKPATDS
jgi:TonB family protein